MPSITTTRGASMNQNANVNEKIPKNGIAINPTGPTAKATIKARIIGEAIASPITIQVPTSGRKMCSAR